MAHEMKESWRRFGMVKGRFPQVSLLLLAALVVFQACGGGQAAPDASRGGDGPDRSGREGQIQIEALLATKDLGLGTSRVSFILQTDQGLVTVPQVTVMSRYVQAPDSSLEETVYASFHSWPYGTRGNYSTLMTFDRVGDWELEVRVEEGNRALAEANIPLRVKEESYTPAIGSSPPLVQNKTLRSTKSLAEITSWPRADPAMYQVSIPEAAGNGKPSVVVMSSPGFCTTPTCGPQADTVRELKEIYKEKANFVHVEIYDNPQEIQRDLTLGRYSPVVQAWGLPRLEGYLNESWVFILDGEGRIASKYEGFASIEELEEGLLEVLS